MLFLLEMVQQILQILAMIYLAYCSKEIALTKHSKLLLTIGYVISFSKMSLLILPIFILHKVKKLINKIPALIILSPTR